VGAFVGLMIYLIFGFKRSLTFSITFLLAAVVGMMYIQDRDNDFHASSAELIRQEKS
jgi:hypothetical protein